MDQTRPMSHTSLKMISKFIQKHFISSRHTRQAEAYRTALQLLDRMILEDPTNAMAFWQKGEVHEALGLHDRALRFYKVAHEMCPRAYNYHDFVNAYDRLKENLQNKSFPKIRQVR